LAERLLVIAPAIIQPAKAVKISAIIRIGLERTINVISGFLQVCVMIGPHEAEVIIGFGGIGGIELNRFLKKFSCLVVKTSLLSRSSIFKIKLAIDDFTPVELSFTERFLKHGERLLCPFRFVQDNC